MAKLLDPTPRPGGQMPAWVITAMEAMLANRVDEGLAKAL
jgi:alpha-beta hydrolase superfamily lysophospholipase